MPHLVITRKNQPGQSVRLTSGRTMIGRGPANQIVLGEQTVSRTHAVLTITQDAVEVCDLHSTNGTFINDRPVARAVLHEFDVLRIGDFEMVHMGDSNEAALWSPFCRSTIEAKCVETPDVESSALEQFVGNDFKPL